MGKEAKVIAFKSKERMIVEERFRHLSDHLVFGPGNDNYGRDKWDEENFKKNLDKIFKPRTGFVKSTKEMEAKIGRIVIFNVPDDMKNRVNYADKLPAMIVRVWSNECVNLKIITDGPDNIWQTSVPKGDQPNQWEWPVIEKA